MASLGATRQSPLGHQVAMARQQQLELAFAASAYAQHSMDRMPVPYRPYKILPHMPMPPPVDASGQAVGVPVSGMNRPGLFHRFQMPGVLNALSQRQFLPQSGLMDHSKAAVAKHKLSDAGGLNIKALWKDATPSGQRENSSSTHSTFMLGEEDPSTDEVSNVARKQIIMRKHSRCEVGGEEPPFRNATSGLGTSYKRSRYNPAALTTFADNPHPAHPPYITDNTSNLSLLADAAALVSSLESL